MTTSWAPFAAEKRRRDGREHHRVACEAYARGESESAIEAFTKALEVDPRNFMALCNRALARLRAKDDANALRDARACVRNAPKWHKAWYRLSQARTALGDDVEALNALAEARRLSDGTGDAEELDRAIEAARTRVRESGDDDLIDRVRASEERREIDVAAEEEELERRRLVRRAKLEAKRAERAVAEEKLKRDLNLEGVYDKLADVNTYLGDLSDSDDSELEAYDPEGRAMFIPRRITDFSSFARRLRTSIGAAATTDAMCELRRYGRIQISLGPAVAGTSKFKAAADAMDACALPYCVIPAWREATSPWPMQLAMAHQDVQDAMWLMETVARVVAGTVYEDAGKSTQDLDRVLDSPLFAGEERDRAPEVTDVSPSALVLSIDESFAKGYAERTSALVRVDWLEAYEDEDARADGETTLVELSVCAELARRVDDEFIVTEDLDPSDREGHGPDGTSFACPRARRPSTRSLVSFFLCPVPR